MKQPRHTSTQWALSASIALGIPSPSTAGTPSELDPLVFRTSTLAVGIASYYGAKDQGRRTANGDVFRREGLTAAHPTLPFGTVLQVTNLKNGRVVTVTVNDRNGADNGRIIDLSEKAAQELDMCRDGLARVSLAIIPQVWKMERH